MSDFGSNSESQAPSTTPVGAPFVSNVSLPTFGIENGLNRAFFDPIMSENEDIEEDSSSENEGTKRAEDLTINNNGSGDRCWSGLADSNNRDENMDLGADDSEENISKADFDNNTPKQIVQLQTKSSFHMRTSGSSGVDGVVYEATFPNGIPGLESVLFDNSIHVHLADSRKKASGSPAANAGRNTRLRSYSDGAPKPPPGGGSGPKQNIYFKDCGGLEQQVNFLKTAILDPLKGDSQAMKRFGIVPPKGVLFHGPPGTGKTRLAMALSNELNQIFGKPVHFIYRKGKDVASKYFGQSSANLRAVFNEAKARKPSVIFFDELDGLCPSRDNPFQNQVNVTIVTTMLGLIDGLPSGEVFILGATNQLNVIDPALRRPGRFDKYLEFLPPTEQGRQQILKIHTGKWKTPPSDKFLAYLGSRTVGFTGADLCKLCMDAFDHGVSRLIPQNGVSYDEVDFRLLAVQDQDWNHVLQKFKPSSGTVFGSALYVPSEGLGAHVEPLTRLNLNNMKAMIGPLLPVKNRPMSSDVKGYYVWSQYDTNLNALLISPLFRSEQLADYSIYQLSAEVLSTVTWRAWPEKINAAFSQALSSHKPAIIYFPQVDEFWSAVESAGLVANMNMSQQMERLRGKSVIVIATGSCDPTSFSHGNPFHDAFSGVGRVYQVRLPSHKDRLAFFSPLFTNPKFHGGATSGQMNRLEDILRNIVETTDNAEVTSILELYDALQQGMCEATADVDKDKKSQSERIVKIWYKVLADYKTNSLYP